MQPSQAFQRFMTRLRGSQLARNVVSNYVAVGWTAMLSLATIPVYIRHLGDAEWGVVAACLTLQNFLAMMDAGFGQIMPRSMARAAGNPAEEARAFRSYVRIYGVLAGAGFLAGQLLAGPAARHWFNAPGVDPSRLELALRLILVQFLFQFANNAHTGFWSGMQLQEEGNLRTTAFTTLRHAGAVATVLWVAPSAFGYLLPFAAGSAIEWISNRRAIARRYTGGAFAAARASPGELRAILRDAGAFTVAILVGLFVTQTDRIVLSVTQDLTQFGYYVVVANLGLAFLNLQGPLMKALFPRIAREDAAAGGGGGRSQKVLLTSVLLLCILPCVAVIVAAPHLLWIWLRNPEIVAAGTAPLRFILAAVALNALYGVIYLRILSLGDARAAITINATALVLVGLLVAVLRGRMGIALGGLIWMTLSVTQLALGGLWLWFRRREEGAIRT